MWDTKRQIVWLATGFVLITFVVYQDARDEMGRVDLFVFAVWEIVFVAVMGAMFLIYRKKKKR